MINLKLKHVARLMLFSTMVGTLFFYHPPKADAAAYCDYENDYYSDATFTTQVGEVDTEFCFVHRTGVTSEYWIHNDNGGCGNASCDQQTCVCATDSYICIDGVCNN